MRTIEVEMSNGKVACAYSPTERVDVETCYRCRRLRAFRDDESGTKVVCARPLPLRWFRAHLLGTTETRRVYRRVNAALPDSIVGIEANNAFMTYAVVVSEDDGPEHIGRLEFEHDCLRLSSGGAVRYDDLRDVYVERRSGGSATASRPTLVLISRQGERLRIGSLESLGALHELAGKVAEARGKAAA